MTELFTASDAWAGGFYELVFELHDNSVLTASNALSHLWACSPLDGIFLRRDIEPAQQSQASAQATGSDEHWYGVATLPNGKQSCCGSFWANFGDDGSWVTFYLPLGSLGRVYPIGAYPFSQAGQPSPEPWLRAVNTWLRDMAAGIYPQVMFQLAIVGFKVDFFGIEAKLGKGLPANEWDGLLVPNGTHVDWYPPAIFTPPHTTV